MSGAIVLLLLAVTIKHDQTALRASGCTEDEETVAKLPAGAPVDVRYGVADGSNCYRVTSTVDGKSTTGYVSAAELEGLAEFERARATASESESIRVMTAVQGLTKSATARATDPGMPTIARLLETNQP